MGQAVNNGRSVVALQIIEGAEDAFFAFDAQFRVTFANPAAEQLLGKKEAELVGKTAWETSPVAGGLPLETACRRAMDERVTVNLNSFHEALQKWYDIEASPSPDGGLLVRFRDITKRMRAEEAVRTERQRFRDVLDQLPAYLVLLSPDYHVPFANRFFRERFGESNGRCCYEYLFQRAEPCEICDTYKVLKTGEPHRWEWTGPDKCDYDIYDFPFADVDGSKLIMEVGLDITERKRAEAELAQHRIHLEELVKERTIQLEAANARLQAEISERKQAAAALRRQAQFPEENPNPVLRVARDGSLLYANAPARTWLASLGWADNQPLPLAVEALVLSACGQSRPAETEAGDSHGHIFWLSATQPAGENYVNIYGRDVTGRKQAEEELRQNREWLRVTLTSIGDGVIASDTEGRITFVNPVAASLTGWTPEEALGQPVRSVLNIINEDTREPAEDIVARVLEDRSAVLLANHSALLTRDGRQIGIEDSAAPILDAAGNVAGVVLVFHDVTGKRHAQTALERAKEEWERTFDSVPDLIAILDNHHRIVRANRAMAQRLGATPGQCVSQQCFHCVHGTNQPPDFCPHALTLRDGKEHVAEVHEDKLGGDFLVSTTPLRDDHGQMMGSVHVARDITERKQAEERIRHQNAVLEGINRILREALTCDTEEQLGRACLSVVEEVTQSKFGLLVEVKSDGRLADIAISDPGWAARRMENDGNRELGSGFQLLGIYGRVLLDGKGFFTNDPQSHPDCIGVPEGHPPLKAFLGVPLEHEGAAIGMVGVANREGGYRPQDVEAVEALALAIVQVLMRKRAERAVRLGEERLRQAQKMESIGVLAGGIAHDFNNLLTGIMGNASLLQDEVPRESRDTLAAVIRASEKAADLTRQMLAYAGKGRFFIEPLDLSRIASDVIDLLRASLPKKVELRLAVPPGLPGIEADRGQVQQIVMNLVINGAESIGTDQAGTVTITTKAVTVSEADRISSEATGEALAPGEYVCLEVEDSGCGMNKETRAKIFDPFFTTKFVGRGLGLAAVAGIVQAQHGAIQLESEPGKGATFRVFLPAVGAPDAPLRTGQTADLRGSGTVLLVDDEAAVRDFARAALERQGYRVLSANNGQEAIRIFEKNAEHVNLVLLDLTMPVMGGDEAIGLLQRRRSDVSVIVMSGYGESEARRVFAGKGASGFLQKPFNAAELAEEVKAVLAEPR